MTKKPFIFVKGDDLSDATHNLFSQIHDLKTQDHFRAFNEDRTEVIDVKGGPLKILIDYTEVEKKFFKWWYSLETAPLKFTIEESIILTGLWHIAAKHLSNPKNVTGEGQKRILQVYNDILPTLSALSD